MSNNQIFSLAETDYVVAVCRIVTVADHFHHPLVVVLQDGFQQVVELGRSEHQVIEIVDLGSLVCHQQVGL